MRSLLRGVDLGLIGLAAAGLAACGGGSVSVSDDLLAEMDAFARGPNRAVALSTALVAPGTLQPAAPDDTILTGVAGRLKSETGSCAQVTQAPGTLSASFGTGCALQAGVVTVSGTLTMSVSHDGNNVILPTMLDGAIDGEAFQGEVAVSTSDGNTFNVLAIAKLGGHDFTVRAIPLATQDATAAITAKGTTPAPAGDPRNLVYTSVLQRFSACHPSGGTLELTSPTEGIDRVLTFSDVTPQTGEATWTEGANVATVTLPHHAFCPPLPAN